MQRITAVGVLSLMGLIPSPLLFSQSTSAQTASQTRERRLDEALADIALLKRMVKEQDRKIADLEKTLRAFQAPAPATAAEVKPRVIVKPTTARWQNPLAWAQIREGMSRAQVEEILGKPTSVEAVIDYQTLNYKGDAPGGGVLIGAVKLTDDRVSVVSLPEF